MTAQYYPVVIERESNGSFSAWIAGLPGVYAAADTAAAAKRGIRGALTAHLRALKKSGPQPRPKTVVTVLRWDDAGLRYVGVSALMGRSTSPAKAAAARRNGMKGGRPRASR